MQRQDTHSKLIGYLLWIFGFLGSHRFYYGKPVTGTIWFFTLGLFFIGWIIYLFTGGLFLIGVLYDFWTLNTQISIKNAQRG